LTNSDPNMREREVWAGSWQAGLERSTTWGVGSCHGLAMVTAHAQSENMISICNADGRKVRGLFQNWLLKRSSANL